jgi:two-component system response regulator MprA
MAASDGTSGKVLVVEDDRAVRESVQRALKLAGYSVSVAVDGVDGLARVDDTRPDAIVLDVMMPKLDGLDMCRALRRHGDRTPVLILTARDAVADRVAGLDAGADDYLPKPFALEELLARLRALLRRSQPDEAEVLTVVDLELHPKRREAHRDNELLELTKTEFDLLELFMRNPDIVLTRNVIYDRIWGYDFGTSSKSLDVYVGYLRRKTEDHGRPRLIYTVRGIGYVLRTTPS